jgi:hypothetical protein
MKFTSVLAIVVLVATAAVSAFPGSNKEINQNAGGAGNGASNKGILSGVLQNGVLSHAENNNEIEQNSNIH